MWELTIKNIEMKTFKKLFTLLIIYSFYSCSAQTIISLNDAAIYINSPDGIPVGVKFVKDTQGRLNKFVGIWKGTANGKSYELKLEKRESFGEYSVKWDQLIGKLRVKDNQGNILFDSFSNSDIEANPNGINFQHNTYEMTFMGSSDCSELGSVFIDILKNPTDGSKMKLFYHSTAERIDPAKCPNYNTFVPLLPTDWMTLIKQ